MAKPDWGSLQRRFLAEHAKTGISPKEWCEAQGLNYTSARRYIKNLLRKNCAKDVRKTAQSQMPHVVVVEASTPVEGDTAQENAGIQTTA